MTIDRSIVSWLGEQVALAGARGFVVGLSGGIDSAVVARLCQLATPDRVLGVVMPCHSDPRDEADAIVVAAHFGIPVVRVDLAPAFDALRGELQRALPEHGADATGVPPDEDIRARVPVANLKPRLRMASLYFIANRNNYLVAGTGNRCELAIGYFTKYGDGGVDVLPIGQLLKSEVRSLARDLGVPAAIIDKPPSAGLWVGQSDEEEMGFTYATLESYLTGGPDAVAPSIATSIERFIRNSAHKRSGPRVPGR